MGIESALFNHLTNKASITALISDRVYNQLGPEGAAYPFITFTVLSTDHTHSMGGAVGLVNVNMQIDIWAESQIDRVTVTEAIRNALDGFKGAMGAEALSIRNCFLESYSSFTEPEIEGRQKPVFRSSMDFSIWHVETLPTL